jgi:phospholipid-transporting ATPase
LSNIFYKSLESNIQNIIGAGVSPTGRYVTIVPFCAILSLTALKEIIEDLKRHKADRKVNHSEVEVLTPSGSTLKKWKDVCVGDIIKVLNEKYFPADLILLSSSEPAGEI